MRRCGKKHSLTKSRGTRRNLPQGRSGAEKVEGGEWPRMIGGLTSVSAQVSGANAPSQGEWASRPPGGCFVGGSRSMAGGTSPYGEISSQMREGGPLRPVSPDRPQRRPCRWKPSQDSSPKFLLNFCPFYFFPTKSLIRGLIPNGRGLPWLHASGFPVSGFQFSVSPHPPRAAEEEQEAGGIGFGFGHGDDLVAHSGCEPCRLQS